MSARARISTHIWQRESLANGTYYKPLDVSNYTDWALQWIIGAGGGGTATFALYGTTLYDRELYDSNNYPGLATDTRWTLLPYAFSASPAGVAASSILPVSDSAIHGLLIALTVTAPASVFTLGFHGQGRA